MMYGWGGGLGFIGMFFMLFFWALVIIGIVMLVRWLAGTTAIGIHHESPIDILKKRYARGEISKEEFERMRHDLL